MRARAQGGTLFSRQRDPSLDTGCVKEPQDRWKCDHSHNHTYTYTQTHINIEMQIQIAKFYFVLFSLKYY